MKQSLVLRSIFISAAAAATLPPQAAFAQQQSYEFAIPAQDADAALRAYARITHLQVVFRGEDVSGKRAGALTGRFNAEDGLDRLLAGSGLIFTRNERGVYVITLASAGNETTVPSGEIVVTAGKRSEDVRKIAGGVTATTGKVMEQIGANSMRDYMAYTPGVIFNGGEPGASTVTIRGVSTTTSYDQGQGATGYFINDVPLTDPYYSVGIPDIDAFDVDNVTVMRGPQGTQFGSASLGGAINYIAAAPDLAAFEARGEGTLESTRHGDVGGSAKGAINIPIVDDRLAVRLTYVYRDQAGYIDNPRAGERDANRAVTEGGRAQVRWEPAEGTRFTYLYLDQTQKNFGSFSDRPFRDGALNNSSYFSPHSRFRTRLHNLRFDQDLGFATLTATATHHRKDRSGKVDLTDDYGAYIPDVIPLSAASDYSSKGNTFEVRLVSKPGRFEYLVGAMYDRTKEHFLDTYYGPGAAASIEANWADYFGSGIGALAAPDDVFFNSDLPYTGKEMAVFGEASYHLSDTLKATVGGRLFQTKSQSQATTSGFFLLFSGDILEQSLSGNEKASGFNPKASITWTPSKDFMAYGVVSKGFRFGGPNVNAGLPGADIPTTFKPDSLINYEIGARSTLLDGKLMLDVSAFYIDWKDIQLRLGTPAGLAYSANAGRARNYGVELASTLNPLENLSIRTAVTYLDAKLDEDFDPGAGYDVIPSGTTLPGASKWKVSNIVTYSLLQLPLAPDILLSHQYISSAVSDFTGGIRQGGYSKFGGRLTLHTMPGTSLTFYVDNLFDKRGVTGGYSYGTPDTLVRTLERPRTGGVTFRFDY